LLFERRGRERYFIFAVKFFKVYPMSVKYQLPQVAHDFVGAFGRSILEVQGRTEVFQRLTFVMGKFSQESVYFVDFGDGLRKRIYNPYFHHQYNEAGNYRVEIFRMFEDKLTSIHAQELTIEGVSRTSIFKKIIGL